ncbi:Piso0_000812 [Millerozyma farinosa CBS 7064]|uniref:Transcription initiation factor TFIID subunit 2 n=1 Tax=Pichia sorbitophila (strain ATCC MYA-4447 / BCRC 22081 / CBS 7064 / NBRC 10061 / NRRL Y-12695) TaxID=559304 RepID=G8YQ48_PICSO|nr:Piso0_000812 [Millerozyma farinosa CBS 7064]
MPSTSYVDLQGLGTPKMNNYQTNTPIIYKGSKLSRNLDLSAQPLKVAHQRVNIDVSLSENKIDGFTELTIVPTSSNLKSVKLDCRELSIKNIYVNGTRTTDYIHNDLLHINDSSNFEESLQGKVVNVFDLYSDDMGIHQHHLIRRKLNYIFGELNYDPRDPPAELQNCDTEELLILLPDLKLELTETNSIHTPGSQPGTLTPHYLKSKNASGETYTPITIRIDYECVNPKNGVNFICNPKKDKKFWHAYTINSSYNISTSSWVPCIDNMWERCTWSVEVNVPRAIKDIGNPRLIGSESTSTDSHKVTASRNGVAKENETTASTSTDVEKNTEDPTNYDNDNDDDGDDDNDNEDDEDEEEEDDDDDDSDNLDLVVCSGDFNNIKETPHPIDRSKKVVSWSIFNPICAHHVGWAVGAFEALPISEDVNEENEAGDGDAVDDTTKADVNTSVIVYSLPGELESSKNACLFSSKAIEYYSREYGSYPFNSYAFLFVEGMTTQRSNFAGLTVISDKLAYPPNLLEPMLYVTDVILECISSQWAGINIVPLTYNDMWCVLGIANYMSLQFIHLLVGTNEYKFKIKTMMNQLIEEDSGKKPLALQFHRYPISDDDLSFIRLKSPLILYILEKRMTKTDRSFGLSRVLPKIFLQAMSGDLANGALSTSHFQYVCEKVNRNKLESFFKQWVYGSGIPVLYVIQRFNRKRSIVEVSIRQIQHREPRKNTLKPENFLNDAIAYIDDEPVYNSQSVFTGPMTIRIHEADGTPYEHIVYLKEGYSKLDIQYNTRFRRLRKNREEAYEPSTAFTGLGDVYSSEADMKEWNFAEFEKNDDENIYNDTFEWMRVDADSEWIAKVNINQSDQMFASQLQYDRHVEAQYDAISFFGDRERPTNIHCTVLTRTLLDDRYYYGIRIAAARALANFSKEDNEFIGLTYLLKAYKEMFCYPNSEIPLANDFSNVGRFLVQRELPIIMSSVRDNEGNVPEMIKKFLLNLVKYNDNSNNFFQDPLYLSKLIHALCSSIINPNKSIIHDFLQQYLGSSDSVNDSYANEVVMEINRLQKLDGLVPSYQSVIYTTCLKEKVRLALHGQINVSFEELLYYTLDKYCLDIRIEAFRGIFLLGGIKNKNILSYFLKICLLDDSSPYLRTQLLEAFKYSICVAAINGSPSLLDDPEFKTSKKLAEGDQNASSNPSNMVIIEDGGRSEMIGRRDAMARATIKGSIEILRRDYAVGKGLRNIFWELIHTSLISVKEKRDLFCLCQVLYEEIDSFIVKIPIPNLALNELKRKFVLRDLGDGKIVIRREGRFKIQLASRKITNGETKPVKGKHKAEPAPTDESQKKIKLKLGSQTGTKRRATARPSTNNNLVSIDPVNRNLVSIRIPKHQRKIEAAHSPSQPNIAASQSKSQKRPVEVNGTTVKIKFSSKNTSLLHNLKTLDNHLFVKISTRNKTVTTSRVPFADTSSSENGDDNEKLHGGNGSLDDGNDDEGTKSAADNAIGATTKSNIKVESNSSGDYNKPSNSANGNTTQDKEQKDSSIKLKLVFNKSKKD